jgi:hypothetical protein
MADSWHDAKLACTVDPSCAGVADWNCDDDVLEYYLCGVEGFGLGHYAGGTQCVYVKQENCPACQPDCVDLVWPLHSCDYIVNTWEGGGSCRSDHASYSFKHDTNHGMKTTSELCCASCL